MRRLIWSFALIAMLAGCVQQPTGGGQPVMAAPTDLVVTAHPGYINIQWEHSGEGVSQFRIYRELVETAAVSVQAFERLQDVPATSRDYNDEDVEPGKRYRYRVAALGEGGAESDPVGQPGEGTEALPAPTFELSVEPGALVMPVGGVANVTVSVTAGNGFQEPLALSLAGQAQGLGISPAQIDADAESTTIQLNAAVDAEPGERAVQLQATSQSGIVRQVDLEVTIEVAEDPAFTVELSPTAVDLVAGGDAVAIPGTVTPVAGFEGSIAVELQAPEGSGLSASPAQLQVAGSEPLEFELVLAAAESAELGSVDVTVAFSSGALSRTVDLSVQVSAPPVPGFVVSLDADEVAVIVGEQSSITGTVTSVHGFTGDVTVELEGSDPDGLGLTTVSLEPLAGTPVGFELAIAAESDAPIGTRSLQLAFASADVRVLQPLTVQVDPVPVPGILIQFDESVTQAPLGVLTEVPVTVIPVHGFQGDVEIELVYPVGDVEVVLDLSQYWFSLDGVNPVEATLQVGPVLQEPGDILEVELIAYLDHQEMLVSHQLEVVAGPSLDLTIDPDSLELEVGGPEQEVTIGFPSVPAGASLYQVLPAIRSAPHPNARFQWDGASYMFEPIPAGVNEVTLGVSAEHGEVPPGNYTLDMLVAFGNDQEDLLQWDSVPLHISVAPPAEELVATVLSELVITPGEDFSAQVQVELPPGFSGDLDYQWTYAGPLETGNLGRGRVTVVDGGPATIVTLSQPVNYMIPAGNYPDSYLWIARSDAPEIYAIVPVHIEVVEPPGLSVEFTPDSLTVAPGTSAQVTATIVPDPGFAGQVHVYSPWSEHFELESHDFSVMVDNTPVQVEFTVTAYAAAAPGIVEELSTSFVSGFQNFPSTLTVTVGEVPDSGVSLHVAQATPIVWDGESELEIDIETAAGYTGDTQVQLGLSGEGFSASGILVDLVPGESTSVSLPFTHDSYDYQGATGINVYLAATSGETLASTLFAVDLQEDRGVDVQLDGSNVVGLPVGATRYLHLTVFSNEVSGEFEVRLPEAWDVEVEVIDPQPLVAGEELQVTVALTTSPFSSTQNYGSRNLEISSGYGPFRGRWGSVPIDLEITQPPVTAEATLTPSTIELEVGGEADAVLQLVVPAGLDGPVDLVLTYSSIQVRTDEPLVLEAGTTMNVPVTFSASPYMWAGETNTTLAVRSVEHGRVATLIVPLVVNVVQ